MGWISALNETYDNCIGAAGVKGNDDKILLPLSHSTAKAQVEITIDISGNFLKADKVTAKDMVTIIPVTENSGTRGAGIFPHPLCDKLCYIAGDLDEYINSNGKIKKDYYNSYIEELSRWTGSNHSSEKVQAIYNYLIKKSVIQDLVECGIIQLDEEGKITTEKIENIGQDDLFIRFIVQKYNASTTYISETWKDTELYKCYDEYYQDNKTKKDICYVTGNIKKTSSKHPSKIRHSGDKSKLISSNDSIGYTYRGRFIESEEAASISYNVSQKAHNALRWLIEKQGYRNESAYIVGWSINNKEIPKIVDSTEDILNIFEEENEKKVYTAKIYAEKLNHTIAGYGSNLKTVDKIVVMSVDTADGSGQGRLSIIFYMELNGSEFLENIKNWHLNCSWLHNYMKKDNKYHKCISAPSPREIALSAYGTEQNGLLKADDRVVKKCVERLLPCIVGNRRFPEDIMAAAVRNVGRPQSFDKNWEKILTITCAIIKKCMKEKYENNEEEWDMELKAGINNRSYQFGRLLAIADIAEQSTYEKNETKRITNAKKYWSLFIKRPNTTWVTINTRLIPYFNKMNIPLRKWYENLLNDVFNDLTEVLNQSEQSEHNKPLSELYLHGYYCQRATIIKKKEKTEETGNE